MFWHSKKNEWILMKINQIWTAIVILMLSILFILQLQDNNGGNKVPIMFPMLFMNPRFEEMLQMLSQTRFTDWLDI